MELVNITTLQQFNLLRALDDGACLRADLRTSVYDLDQPWDDRFNIDGLTWEMISALYDEGLIFVSSQEFDADHKPITFYYEVVEGVGVTEIIRASAGKFA